jgi:hypothetical protein
VDWIHLAQDRDHLGLAIVNTIMKLRVAYWVVRDPVGHRKLLKKNYIPRVLGGKRLSWTPQASQEKQHSTKKLISFFKITFCFKSKLHLQLILLSTLFREQSFDSLTLNVKVTEHIETSVITYTQPHPSKASRQNPKQDCLLKVHKLTSGATLIYYSKTWSMTERDQNQARTDEN